MRAQRKIVLGTQALDYYTNNLFRFKAEIYNDCYGRLNDVDKKIFYNRTDVSE